MLTGPSLVALLVQELDGDCRGLIVDMSGCEFLGSSGLAALVEGKRRADSTAPPVPVVLAGVSRIASRALEVAGLQPLFASYASAEEATAAFGN